MADSIRDRLKHSWDVFRGKNEVETTRQTGSSFSYRPERPRGGYFSSNGDRTIVGAIQTRIAIDATSFTMRHIRQDPDTEAYLEDIDSYLDQCLTVSANLDQTGRHFRQDVVQTMLKEGVVVAVPIVTDLNPKVKDGMTDIKDIRVGRVVEWFPEDVRVDVYNQRTGQREQIIVPKRIVAIVENPLYEVMNEPNSTFQRLKRKLGLLDNMDEVISSGKLDLIIQLPYVIKSEARREQAETRRKDIEKQLRDGQYGIAYTDGTERITQLNRPAENTMLDQVKYLTEQLHAQTGLTPEVFNGTADETAMLNYYNRTIYPILDAITAEFTRKFLSKTGRSQGQAIRYFRDPFQFSALDKIAEMSDKFTRNEIMTSNEIRAKLGMKAVDDPKADILRNPNMPSEDLELEQLREGNKELNPPDDSGELEEL